MGEVGALTLLSIAMGFAALALSLGLLYRVRGVEEELYAFEDLSEALRGFRRLSNPIKRYVLFKAVCPDDVDTPRLREVLNEVIARGGGRLFNTLCSVDLITYAPSTGRGILRVRGHPICVQALVYILSTAHMEGSRCLFAPVRTSGLLTRLRRMVHR